MTRQLFSITLDLSSNNGWKWSNGVGKSEISIIWCLSITNNVKSCKIFNETAQKRPTSLISHWFPVEMVHIGPKLFKRKGFFLCCKNMSEVSRVCHMKADVRPILKMWCFFLLSFKPEFLLLKVGSNRQKYCEAASKNKYAFDFDFLPPYWISVGPIGMFWGWFNGTT